MQKLSLNYKAQNEDLYLLTGNLIYAPSKRLLNNNPFLYIEKETLHVCFFDDISISSLDDAFQRSIKERSYKDRLILCLSSIPLKLVTFFIFLIFVLALGVLSAYGSAAYALIETYFNTSVPVGNFSTEISVFLVLYLLVTGFIISFPIAFKGEIHEYISRINGQYYNDKFYSNRFKKYLKIYHKKYSINNIVLWNPANKGFAGTDFWSTFIKCCLVPSDFTTYFCIHTDEKYKTELILEKIYKNIEYDLVDIDDKFINFSNQHEIPKEYLNKTEIQLLEVMVFCSTKNINIINKDIVIEGYSCPSEHVISLSFVEYLVRNLPERLPDLNTFIDGVPLLVFFRRCTNDYGFTINYNKSDLKLVGISKDSSLMNGYDLNIISNVTLDELTDEGNLLIITALVDTNVHIRIFDANGQKVVDKKENELFTGEALNTLKQQLNTLADVPNLSQKDKQRIIENAASCADCTLTNEISNDIEDELAYIYHYCSENSQQIIKEITDPVTVLILNILFLDKSIYSKSRIKLIETFISSIEEYEHYFLLRNYWSILFCEECIDNVSPYILINVSAIIKLSICFERAGLYEPAANIHKLLITLYPFRSTVSLARLDERKGTGTIEYEEGITKLNSIWGNFSFKLDDLPSDDQLRYLLTYSWIVVSGRIDHEKTRGKARLLQAKEIIDSSHEIKNTNDQLWHFHNSVANYDEWDKKYDSAIEEHKKCLKIPGLSQKWLSGTLVNIGIAYRLLFCDRGNVSYIDKSISYGQSGLDLKNELGDNDELPIALHNLSLSMLFKFITSKEVQEDNLIFSNKHSDAALCIFEETGSQKKRVMALFEYYISSIIIKNNLKKNPPNFDKINKRSSELKNYINKNDFDDAQFKDMKLLLEGAFQISISDKHDILTWINNSA